MSLASLIVGIPGLEVERVHRRKSIEIWAKPFHRPSCPYCGSEQLRIKATDKRTVKRSRQGNRVMTLHLKSHKYHCRQCGRYFRHRFTGIKPRFHSSEGYRLVVYEAHHGGITQRKLSRTHHISPSIVERRYQLRNQLKRSVSALYLP